MSDDLIERLLAEEDRMVRLHDLTVLYRDKNSGSAAFSDFNSLKHAIAGRDPVLSDAAAEIAALRAEVLRLREALRPFAQPERNPIYADASHELISVTSGDLRRARAALAASPETPEESK